MSLLNVNLNILAYADGPASNQPQVRLADLKWSIMGLPTDNFRNTPIFLAPGETMVLANTSRAISFTPATVFTVTKVNEKMRIAGSFGQRTSRPSGDNTTQWTISASGDVARALFTGTGLAPDFTQIQAGDQVTFDAGFNTYNQGDFIILNKGANFIEFRNSLAVAETVLAPARVYSNGPVQKGDVLDLTSPAFAFPNRGSFPITRVTDQFIECVNLNVLPGTFSGVTSELAVYPYSYKWLVLAVDRRLVVQLNGDTGMGIEVEPHVEGDFARNPGLFMKRGKVFQVTVTNPGLQVVSGILMLAE